MPMSNVDAFWHGVTRLGEAQILLPTALALALWLAWRARAPRLAAAWLIGIAVAAVVTTASKVAFIGYGWGWAALDYTGISGHAMFASVILPVVCMALCSTRSGARARQWAGLAIGMVLALLVGISRAKVGVHSASEIVAGWAVGGVAAAAVIRAAPMPSVRLPLWLPIAVSLWLGMASAKASPSITHDLVTGWSLAVSGRTQAYTRSDMLKVWLPEPSGGTLH